MIKISTYTMAIALLIILISINTTAQIKNTNIPEEDGRDTTLVGRILILIKDNFRAPIPPPERTYILSVPGDEYRTSYKIIFDDDLSGIKYFLKHNVTAEVRGILMGQEIYAKEININK